MKIIKKDVVTSTNDELRQLAKEGAKSMTFLTAKQQTAGKGRHGRQWQSDAGNLFASVLLRGVPLAKLHEVVYVAALAMLETVESYLLDNEIALKWPNDILVDGKKIGGILVETELQNGELQFAVVGMGLNVASSPKIDGVAATSMRELGSEQELADVVELLAEAFVEYVETWLSLDEGGGFERIANLWLQNAAYIDEEISVKLPQGQVTGIFRGINEKGEMLLEQNGVEKAYSSAEIL